MSDERINEDAVLRLMERKQHARMHVQLANRMLDVCSDDARPKWEEMLTDAREILEEIAAQEAIDLTILQACCRVE